MAPVPSTQAVAPDRRCQAFEAAFCKSRAPSGDPRSGTGAHGKLNSIHRGVNLRVGVIQQLFAVFSLCMRDIAWPLGYNSKKDIQGFYPLEAVVEQQREANSM